MQVLASDIGGSYARFALFETVAGGVHPLHVVTVPSQAASFAELMERVQESWSSDLRKVDAVAVAAAGPMRHGAIRMTNADYRIDTESLRRIWPHARIHLMNDFEAQGYGLLSRSSGLEPLLPGAGTEPSLTAVIGAGTGFGTCYLLHGKRPRVLGTECGFLPLALEPSDPELFQALHARHPEEPLVAEHVLSGSGLRQLHRLFTGEDLDPSDFTRETDFPTSRTCATFSTFYARIARAVAFAVLPGRIVIVGGLARKTPALVKHPNFKQEFLRAKGSHLEYLRSVTVQLDTVGDLGLWGAATRATFDLDHAL